MASTAKTAAVMAGVLLAYVAIGFGMANTPKAKEPAPWSPAPKPLQDTDYPKLAVRCHKGLTVLLFRDRGAFYELDANGKPVPCAK